LHKSPSVFPKSTRHPTQFKMISVFFWFSP
jgi:hypothetical protein